MTETRRADYEISQRAVERRCIGSVPPNVHLLPATMIPSPSSSPRPIFHNRTNFNEASRPPAKYQQKLSFALPTPPKCTGLKRSVQEPNCPRNRKRAKPLEKEEDVCEEAELAKFPSRRERIRGTTRSHGYLAIRTGNRPHDGAFVLADAILSNGEHFSIYATYSRILCLV